MAARSDEMIIVRLGSIFRDLHSFTPGHPAKVVPSVLPRSCTKAGRRETPLSV